MQKVVLISPYGAGKTSWVRRLKGKGFEKRYIRTLGVEVTDFHGFQIWDTAGRVSVAGDVEAYCSNADLFIIFALTQEGLTADQNTARYYSPGARHVVVWNQKPGEAVPDWLPEGTRFINVKTGEGIWSPLKEISPEAGSK